MIKKYGNNEVFVHTSLSIQSPTIYHSSQSQTLQGIWWHVSAMTF